MDSLACPKCGHTERVCHLQMFPMEWTGTCTYCKHELKITLKLDPPRKWIPGRMDSYGRWQEGHFE